MIIKNKFIYEYNNRLSAILSSMFVFGVLRNDALELLMYEIADLSRENERVHRIQASVVPCSVPRFAGWQQFGQSVCYCVFFTEPSCS